MSPEICTQFIHFVIDKDLKCQFLINLRNSYKNVHQMNAFMSYTFECIGHDNSLQLQILLENFLKREKILLFDIIG